MDAEKTLPLSGIRVLELGHAVMGPTCGMILADLGAEVYKVERTGKGDDTRYLKGFGSGFFTYFNRNKKSISIDLKSEKGKELLLELISQVDIFLENFGPGTVERLGFGYEACRQINPRLIYCSLKGFMPGPYEKRTALDEVVQMMGGLAYMTGLPGKPLRAGTSITDILGGSYGVIGIMAALHERHLTGLGKFVQATLFESVAYLMGQHMAVAAITGTPPPPMSVKSRVWSVYDLFNTADNEQVFLAITSDQQWNRVCETFNFQDWKDMPRLATNQQRVDASDWLIPELEKRFGSYAKKELMTMAEKAGIPFAPVSQPIDLFEDKHLNASGGLMKVNLPAGGQAKLPKLPVRLGGNGFDLRHQPPAVGQGSKEFYLACGYSKEQIDEFAREGVVQVIDAEE